jgi:predicted lipoprotein with Yx(FWY)xxD motif
MALRLWLLLALALPLPLASFAAEPATPAPAARPGSDPSAPPVRERQGVLVDLKGRGLYIYTRDDVRGRSKCDAKCVLLWRPLYANDTAKPRGPFTLIKRDDGRLQWALRDQPLYLWSGDSKRGDAGGDGAAGVWKLVRVTPAATPAGTKP